MHAFDLIRKIDGYHADLSAVEKIPPRVILKFGALASYVLWGTSFSEYFGYRFWRKSVSEKRTYMTRRHMFKFYDRYCDSAYRARIGDKAITKQYYGGFMDRSQFDWNAGYEAFSEFCKLHPHIFIKKRIGWGGEHARCEHIENELKCREVWESIDETYLIEEKLQNCSEVKEIAPESLNTIKVTTLLLNGEPEIQFAIIRFGNRTQVDNVHLGGICAGVNIEDGIVETKAIDNRFCEYEYHPATNKPITGFRIPCWAEVKKLAVAAARITPQLRYSSWDIAVTDRGPVLIEGNWDAEFYAEQMLYQRGHRKMFVEKLERSNG